jgi:hypothetical protein
MQRTVTTFTTETELLGLSEAAKHLQWCVRFLNYLGFTPSHVDTIECDDVVFDTKLMHMDIHHHWLRQEVREGRIAILWVPTSHDGCGWTHQATFSSKA